MKICSLCSPIHPQSDFLHGIQTKGTTCQKVLIADGLLHVRTQVCRRRYFVAYPQIDKQCLDLDENLHNVNSVFSSQKETSYSNIGFDLLGQNMA